MKRNPGASEKKSLWKTGEDPQRPWERVRTAQRGTLFQLEDGNSRFCHIAVINAPVVPGAYRGRHYHLKKLEHFFLATGEMDFVWFDLDTREKGRCRIESGHRLIIRPRLAHAFLAISDAVLVEYSDSAYDEADSISFDPEYPPESV